MMNDKKKYVKNRDIIFGLLDWSFTKKDFKYRYMYNILNILISKNKGLFLVVFIIYLSESNMNHLEM